VATDRWRSLIDRFKTQTCPIGTLHEWLFLAVIRPSLKHHVNASYQETLASAIDLNSEDICSEKS